MKYHLLCTKKHTNGFLAWHVGLTITEAALQQCDSQTVLHRLLLVTLLGRDTMEYVCYESAGVYGQRSETLKDEQQGAAVDHGHVHGSS